MGRSLDALDAALLRLGSPQNRRPAVLIGGTNGKGSTSAMVESVLRACGLRTGLFHSPAAEAHEHVWLDGQAVEPEPFIEHFLAADRAGDLTWFEALTAAAFSTFARAEVDMAVVEVGLGGRHDCTNTIAQPEVSAVVSVALDHEDVLGPDLESIAREKAGIFRPRRPAVIGSVPEPAGSVLEAEALRVQADFRPVEPPSAGKALQDLGAHLPLPGAHQAHNAAVALAVVSALQERRFVHGSVDQLRRGLESCRWPGRLERLEHSARPIILDGAHNPAAVDALVAHWQDSGYEPVDVLFGVFRDKDAAAMLRRLSPVVRRLIPTWTEHPRALSGPEIASYRQRFDPSGDRSETGAPLDEALAVLLKQNQDKPLLIVGSLDLVGRARTLLTCTLLT